MPHRQFSIYRTLFGSQNKSDPGNVELLWRLLWIVASSILIAYASYLYFGSMSVAYTKSPVPILVTDVVEKPGEHHVSGVVLVPTPCHGITVKTVQVSDTQYRLAFTTWQEPSRKCEKRDQARSFRTVVFAPAYGISFVGSLDGEEIPLQVISHR